MTFEKREQIRKFFLDLQITPRLIRDIKDWEVDFYLNECGRYGISKKDMAEYILEAKDTVGKKISNRIQVKDLTTGRVYKSLTETTAATGINREAIYRQKERFELVRMTI